MNAYESAALGGQELGREILYNLCFASENVVAMLCTEQGNVGMLCGPSSHTAAVQVAAFASGAEKFCACV